MNKARGYDPRTERKQNTEVHLISETFPQRKELSDTHIVNSARLNIHPDAIHLLIGGSNE